MHLFLKVLVYRNLTYLYIMDTYLPKTKKDQIRDLILGNNNYSADEIAKMVHSTKENVWKEKSRMVSEGVIIRTRKTLKISAERKDETTLVVSSTANSEVEGNGKLKKGAIQFKSLSPRINSRSNNEDYTRYFNILPLDSEAIKKLYTEFKNKKKPVDIIVEYGFPPSVVEVEYRRFLKIHDIDIDRLQDYIGNEVLKHPIDGTNLLGKKYKQNGYLTTDEIIEWLGKRMMFLEITNFLNEERQRLGNDTRQIRWNNYNY